MLHAFFDWGLNITQGLGYWGVLILMTLESSFVPFPSEIVVPPAAYLASSGQMALWLVIVAGIAGSVLGAVINYFLAASLGRAIIYRLAAKPWARWLLISPEKIERAEKYFLDSAGMATFFGRLIPVVRQLVSLPAGFCRMPFWRFIFLTALGSSLWVLVLALLGYFLGANREQLELYYKEISLALVLLAVLWLAWKWRKLRQAQLHTKISSDKEQG